MSVDYDYYGIEIINSKISKNKEKATVLFRALYKEGALWMNDYVYIDAYKRMHSTSNINIRKVSVTFS
jgi:hypothetical protein